MPAVTLTTTGSLDAVFPSTASSSQAPPISLDGSDPVCVDVSIQTAWKSLSGDVDPAGCLDALAILQHKAGPNKKTPLNFYSKIYYPGRPPSADWPLPDGGQNSMLLLTFLFGHHV